MNDQERFLFERLKEDREDNARLLNKESTRHLIDTTEDIYPDQAHFVYELLQNADDANATTARLVLEDHRLIYAHNGTRLFSISNPDSETEDKVSGKRGDINAITSFGSSNKTREPSIGKFGIGFRSVFQYTESPRIYDPNFRFEIQRSAIPSLIENDFPERKNKETLFELPFNHPGCSPKQAYEDIENKLVNLCYPLLFLPHLTKISFKSNCNDGWYRKHVLYSLQFDDVTVDCVSFSKKVFNKVETDKIFLFSRKDKTGLKYSVGFFLDSKDHLVPKDKMPAFCFFPTKEYTNLSFIVHAPFLLTNNRAGIKAGEQHNIDMIRGLAKLAAKSIVILKKLEKKRATRFVTDNIVTIIPVDPDLFSDLSDRDRISFLPFYQEILHVFKMEEIIPSLNGYVKSEHAYWADTQQITEIFSNKHLVEICGDPDAKWAFPTIGRRHTSGVLKNYIDELTKTYLDDDCILNGRSMSNVWYAFSKKQIPIQGITPDFVGHQSFKWLHRFYQWLESRKKTELVKIKEVFVDQDKKVVPAFDKENHPILFLPAGKMTNYHFVHPELLKNKATSRFLKSIGIKEPSPKDYIYKAILPKYQNEVCKNDNSFEKTPELFDIHALDERELQECIGDFQCLFQYYCACPQEDVIEYINYIRQFNFLVCFKNGGCFREYGKNLYFPELKSFFEPKPSTCFVLLDEYQKIAGETKKQDLITFLSDLGVRDHIPVLTFRQDINPSDKKNNSSFYRDDLPKPNKYPRQPFFYTEKYIDGCRENINSIVAEQSMDRSIALWNTLLEIIGRECISELSLSDVLNGFCEWHFHKKLYNKEYISLDEMSLKSSAWLVDRNGIFRKPEDMTTSDLAGEYDQLSSSAQKLIAFLGFSPAMPGNAEDSDANLTERQREDIELGRFVRENGLTKEDLEEIRRIKCQKAKKHAPEAIDPNDRERAGNEQEKDDLEGLPNDDESPEADERESDVSHDRNPAGKARPAPRLTKEEAEVEVLRDIVKRTRAFQTVPEMRQPEEPEDSDSDRDDCLPSPVNYSRQLERAKQKSAEEIAGITRKAELQKRAIESTKYSYGWFKALLEMESLESSTTNSGSRQISIEFSKVEREPGTQRILVLKQPNRYIPQFVEDLADIPLELHLDDAVKKVVIEVSNIKSYTLRVKLKNPDDIHDIDLSSVHSASINARSPVFLLEELRRQFMRLDFPDDYNMQDNLCGNIEFIFGPPGTGKTTYLARKILTPMMAETDDRKVLVLTPTNKAADVLTRRIMEMEEFAANRSYEKWLVRFGSTGDETIEKSAVFKDKTFDIRTFHRNVTVTTIARFPYDFFMPDGDRLHLRELKWDYIVIDEASMIPLVNIVYPLYKKKPQKFIVAGDPFQIQPIAAVDLWKDENIYSFVHLDSFRNPRTIPHPYKIENLSTQYRSVPEIGEIFSAFAYDGILKHYRTSESRIPLNLGNKLEIKPLNILKFPVSRYESIYRTKRLQRSSAYQIYSALFTYEYICYLSGLIAENNPGKLFKIGVIAPYRAQSDLIEKLFASKRLPDAVNVQVGTIHGFQGDECDMVFSVFNPPPGRFRDIFLNNRNIINVSISRARDYLFLVMPDDKTENIIDLQCVKKVEYLVKRSDCWTESLTPELEQMLFGDSNYLENNAFSTSHQSVNVYGLPEKTYEVRTEENAVDIQIHTRE